MTKGALGNMHVKSHNGKAYADEQALHYLCQPGSLSGLCPKDCLEEYEVVGNNVRNRTEELLEFEDTLFNKHPTSAFSADCNIDKIQSVRKRHKKKLAWVGQWNFLDVADFGADILTCNDITEEMEAYSFTVLAFCHNYHSKEDLKFNGSSVSKL